MRRQHSLLSWSPLPLVTLAALVGTLLGCEDCAREGCDSLAQRAAQNGTSLAGVVAESSDVVGNGCQECPFGTAELQAWQVEAPVTSESAVAELMAQRSPDWEKAVSERYSIALAPGFYLLCARPSCVNLTIADGQTSTANVKRRNGPTSFFVGGEDAERLAEDFGLDVGF